MFIICRKTTRINKLFFWWKCLNIIEMWVAARINKIKRKPQHTSNRSFWWLPNRVKICLLLLRVLSAGCAIVIWSKGGWGLWGRSDREAGWAQGGSWDTLLALQFNHCIPRKVLTVVLWKLLKLLSKVKWNCSLSRQHWENKGICSWLLINVERDQHKGFIKLYITGVI